MVLIYKDWNIFFNLFNIFLKLHYLIRELSLIATPLVQKTVQTYVNFHFVRFEYLKVDSESLY